MSGAAGMNPGLKSGTLIHAYCQVLGTGDDGSSPCLLVSVERAPRYRGASAETAGNTVLQRYLFNVGEGTQRFCGEAGVKLGKVDKLFLTGTGAEEHAGLTELILTLSALSAPSLEVFGPSGVDGLVSGVEACSPRFGRCPEVSTTPLHLGPDEAQCSYVIGGEHMEVRCGVVDPAKLTLSTPILTNLSVSTSDSGSESESGSESSSGSSSDEKDSSDESGSSDESDSGDGSEGHATNDSAKGGDGNKELSSCGVGQDEAEKAPAINDRDHMKGFDNAPFAENEGRLLPICVVAKTEDDASATASSGRRTEDIPPPGTVTDFGHKGLAASWSAGSLPSTSAPKAWHVAGVPARGPTLLYLCRILYGAGPIFMVVLCPNIGYVRAIRDHTIVSDALGSRREAFVIHLSPEDVVQDAAYTPLLAIPGEHIVLGCGPSGRARGAGGLQHRRMAERSVQLNYVAPQAFPLHSALRSPPKGEQTTSKEMVERHVSGASMIVGPTLAKIVILPVQARGVDFSTVRPPVNVDEIRGDFERRVEEAGLSAERNRIVRQLGDVRGSQENEEPRGNDRGGLSSESCVDTTASPRAREAEANAGLARPRLPALPNASLLPPPPPPPPSPPPLSLWNGCGPLPPKRARRSSALETVSHSRDHEREPLSSGVYNSGCPPRAIGSHLFSGGGLAGAEVFFLGTGSAAPTKNRGCSGILLRIPAKSATAQAKPLRLLVDAGAGTLGHLERQFGRQGARREIQELHCIWISHKHADHHTGAFRIIVEHHRACRHRHSSSGADSCRGFQPLVVVAPSTVLEFLAACQRFSGEAIAFRGIPCSQLERGNAWRGGSRGLADQTFGTQQPVSALLEGMRSVPVIHCKEAYGLVLQLWQGGAKVVYSGDTRPCNSLVKAGFGAELLIHEATFDDTKRQDAVSKYHCTTSEALNVGRRMRAKEVVLTHFSQRYPRVPVLDHERAQTFCVAFDGMVVNSVTAGVLPAAARLLSQVLERQADEEDAEDTVPA